MTEACLRLLGAVVVTPPHMKTVYKTILLGLSTLLLLYSPKLNIFFVYSHKYQPFSKL